MIKLILNGCWASIKICGFYIFPIALYSALVGTYEFGFSSAWQEYLFLTCWWGCYASLIMMWQSYKETKHPIMYKIWATILFYAFIGVILQMAKHIS